MSLPALGEAAIQLPWLSPAAAALVALVRPPAGTPDPCVRADPGCVLLLLRHAPAVVSPFSLTAASLREPALLDAAAGFLEQDAPGFVDWSRADLAPVHRATLVGARLAERLAAGRCCPERAYLAGLLAPLGWLAGCAVAPSQAVDALGRPHNEIQSAWGLDPAAIGRRLGQSWRLPGWLTAVVGHLGLPVDAARQLGAEPTLFQVVQLAVAWADAHGAGLRLPVGANVEGLCQALGVDATERAALHQILTEGRVEPLPAVWEDPRGVPLLAPLLRTAAENRRLRALPVLDRMQDEVDRLHDTLARQQREGRQRLHEQKLSAVAELAAGAGHEINNPLAVISGQAQYLLLHEEEAGRRRSLQTIVGQTQRIHQTLTELMQFARPPAPHPVAVDVAELLRAVVGALGSLAEHRRVRLTWAEPGVPVAVLADPVQVRAALLAVVRNAVEAAPAEGWAAVHVEPVDDAVLALVVEDNGPGPGPADVEHLFDPFYSGRKAGRGRGLGLSAAWRLAREHGGDVSFADAGQGTTRFVLRWPRAAVVAAAPPTDVPGTADPVAA